MATTKEFSSGFAKVNRLKLKMGADYKALKGTIAAIAKTGDDQGCVVDGATATNLLSIGRFGETVDNTGGAVGAKSVEVLFHREFELLKMVNDATNPVVSPDDIGSVCFIKDNNTASILGTSRSVAGVVWKVEDGLVWYEPASRYLPSESEVTALDVRLDAAEDQIAVLATGYVHIPLTSFLDADGDPLAKFSSAGSPTFGFALADSEALCIRWNNDATPGTSLCEVSLPADLDDTAAAYLEFLCSKSGATVGDATTLTCTAFLIAAGDLHDADSNAGGVTDALVGNATAKTTKKLTLTIAAADIPVGARSMTFTVTPTAGLLGTDDLLLHNVQLKYTRKAA